jgi:uncharacterized protein YjdB
MLLAVSYANAQGPYYPSIDTYIWESNKTTAYNTNTLEVRKSSNFNERITFIEFNIGSTSTVVSKAELNLWLYNVANATSNSTVTTTASLYEFPGTFANNSTWNSIGTFTLGNVLSSNTISATGPPDQDNTTANGWYKFDITTLYNRVAGEAGTDKKIKLCLKATTLNLVLRFSSSEYSNTQYKPYVSTVPVSAAVSVTGVSVSPGTVNVGIGATTNLTATVAPADATNKTVAWTSSNNSVATVSAAGVVTGVAVGSATITATTQDGSFTSTSSISVIIIPVTGVSIPATTTVVTGANVAITATVAPTNATNKTVSWSTNNSSVAIISASGVVTGVSAGSATITATTQDGSYTSTSAITVSAPATNYVLNPGFESNTAPAASPTNWFEWTGSVNNYIINSGVVAGNVGLGNAVGGTPRTGTNYLSIAQTGTWPTTYDVLNKQDLTGLPNGTYTLSGWFRGNGGSGYFNIGGIFVNFTMPMTQWTQITIRNFNVTNGTATVQIQYNSTAGTQLDVDDILLTLEPKVLVLSGSQTSSALTNSSAEITIGSTAELTVDASRTVQSVTLNPGAKLTISAGQTFTATNGITLESTAGGGTATFVDETAGSGQTITGSVQQYLATTRNWYVSSPVSNAVAPAGYTYYRRNEPAVSWTAVSAGAGLTAGVGYIALPTSTGPITFTTQSGGKLNTGTITIPLTWQGASNKGYNLIGNPYPSHLTWNKAFTDANVAKIEPSIWYRTNSGGSNSSGWSFKTYNAFTGVGVPEGTTGIIPPMQAFWVLAKVDGQSIQFTNSMRSHQTSNPLKAPAAQKSENKIMRLQVSNETASDETVLLFNANAMDSYDIYDSPKMLNNDSNVPDIFTVIDTKKIVINGMSEVKYNVEIPIGFSTATANDFSISISEMSNFESGTRIILKDKLQPNAEIELTEGQVYNFSSPAITPATDRFSLQFRAPGVSTGLDKSNKLNAQVFVNAANQITIIAPVKSNFSIYNAMGQQVTNGFTTSNYQTSNIKLAAGMYVVNVNNQSTRVIIK